MITINFFTSGKHTQPMIEVLKRAETIKLLHIYAKLPPGAKIARADLFLVADFGQIIPPAVFQQPKYGTLCLHPSLLPKYRGASPASDAIMNADQITGATIFKLDEKIDHGPIISQFKEPIRPNDTQTSLLVRLFQKGAQELVRLLPAYIAGRIKPRPQNHSQATYTRRLSRKDGLINWRQSDAAIERFIRAMTVWPGAWTNARSHSSDGGAPAGDDSSEVGRSAQKRLKILKAHLEKSKLVIDEVQLEAKKPISWQQFQAGHPGIKFN